MLNVEDDGGLPTLVSLDEFEAVEGNGFDIHTGMVAVRIEFLSKGDRFQKMSAIISFNFDLMDP
jgi:hypothetical protein